MLRPAFQFTQGGHAVDVGNIQPRELPSPGGEGAPRVGDPFANLLHFAGLAAQFNLGTRPQVVGDVGIVILELLQQLIAEVDGLLVIAPLVGFVGLAAEQIRPLIDRPLLLLEGDPPNRDLHIVGDRRDRREKNQAETGHQPLGSIEQHATTS